MNHVKSLVTTGLVVSLFAACTPSAGSDQPGLAEGKNYVKVTFNGQTKTYTDVNTSQAGNTLGSITAGSSETDYLDLSFYGAAVGSYPYKQKVSEDSGVSQVEYKTAGKVFNNYKARVCSTTSGYYSTQDTITLTEYVPGKMAKGTFTGELLDQNNPDKCSTKGVPFNGEFSITQ